MFTLYFEHGLVAFVGSPNQSLIDLSLAVARVPSVAVVGLPLALGYFVQEGQVTANLGVSMEVLVLLGVFEQGEQPLDGLSGLVQFEEVLSPRVAVQQELLRFTVQCLQATG